MSDAHASPIIHWAGPREMSLLLEPFDPYRQPTISPSLEDTYSVEFFENMVVKIAESFPVEAFALQQGCSREEVVDALYAVFLQNCPLSEAQADGAINAIEEWRESAAAEWADLESGPGTNTPTGSSGDSTQEVSTPTGTDEGESSVGSGRTAEDPIIIE
ncbi:hypothetical protein N7528_004229 [Penicillium herquei]|nr:hypothetical protein N7528_004229 [Penicillium herquei]